MKAARINKSAIVSHIVMDAAEIKRQRDGLLAALRHGVSVSESLHTDYEYCAEWRDAMDVMRTAIAEVEAA